MKNILIITPAYPLGHKSDSTFTSVVRDYVKGFNQLDTNILIIHIVKYYPKIIKILLFFLKNFIFDKTEGNLEFKKNDYIEEFLEGNSKGLRFYVRRRLLNKKLHYRNISSHINDFLKREQFTPNFIIGHWLEPQMQLIKNLKLIYPFVKSGITLHGDYHKLYRLNSKRLESIDFLGARNQLILSKINVYLEQKKISKPTFLVYSGVSNKVLEKIILKEKIFKNKSPLRIIYVGKFIKRKNVKKILVSLKNIAFDYELNLVGTGLELEKTKRFSTRLNINKVRFHGKISHEKTLDLMQQSHVLIMVSDNETFGLVYLEAMATGCLIIHNMNGNLPGILTDYNSFDIKADFNNIKVHLDTIMAMDYEKIIEIIYSNYLNIKQRDYKNVALKYLDRIKSI